MNFTFKIEHISLWVSDIEKMKDFYVRYFQGRAGEKYINSKKKFESYFIEFSTGTRLEIMHKEGLVSGNRDNPLSGYAHIAFSTGSKEKVDEFTAIMKETGFTIADGPRTTGDGYYESVIIDPEGNRIEITI